jgi:DNA replication protein DnaC
MSRNTAIDEMRAVAAALHERKQRSDAAFNLARQGDIVPDVPLATEGIVEAVHEILSRCKPRTDAEVYEYEFRHVREDMLAWGWKPHYLYEIAEWNCPKQERVFNKCCELLAKSAVVALVGVRGCGKTTLCAQYAVRQARKNMRHAKAGDKVPFRVVWYRKLSQIVAEFKDLYGGIQQDELKRRREFLCRSVDVLVVDETQECEDVRMKDTMLTDLVDLRYAANLSTVLISNLRRDEFEKSVGDSIVSRINEGGLVIPCEWESWRGKEGCKHG